MEIASFWPALTWLGDSGLLMPAALWIAVWLALRRTTRPSAVSWVLFFGSGALLVLASKLAFLGWGLGIASINFTGFSGHTTFATSIWPVAFWLIASRGPRGLRIAVVLAGWVLAAGIGVSRVAIDAHSWSEVFAGFALGVAVSAGFLRAQQNRPLPRFNGAMVAISLATPLLVFAPGERAPTQAIVEGLATWLAKAERPFTRDDLLHGRTRSPA